MVDGQWERGEERWEGGREVGGRFVLGVFFLIYLVVFLLLWCCWCCGFLFSFFFYFVIDVFFHICLFFVCLCFLCGFFHFWQLINYILIYFVYDIVSYFLLTFWFIYFYLCSCFVLFFCHCSCSYCFLIFLCFKKEILKLILLAFFFWHNFHFSVHSLSPKWKHWLRWTTRLSPTSYLPWKKRSICLSRPASPTIQR